MPQTSVIGTFIEHLPVGRHAPSTYTLHTNSYVSSCRGRRRVQGGMIDENRTPNIHTRVSVWEGGRGGWEVA